MRKEYQNPELELIILTDDVITTSSDQGFPPGTFGG